MTVYHYDKELGKVVEGPPPQKHEKFGEAPFFIMPEFQEYRAVGVDNRVVRSRTEHKQMLKEHNLEEVGNDAPSWWKEKKYEEKYKGERNG